MRKISIQQITKSALIAALYVALTHLSNLVGLANGPIQIRFSEALCILPFFMPSSAVGLFIGCIIANLTTGAVVWDIVFGSLATLIGALITSKIKNKYLAPIPTVVANVVVIPFIILFCYTARDAWTMSNYLFGVLGIFIGEMVSAYLLGMLLLTALNKHKNIFK